MHPKRLLSGLACIFLLLLAQASWAAQGEDDFLPPDQAFRISAHPLDNKTVELRWRIADGYYLYKNKFRFHSDTPGVETGEAELSPAEVKHDPFFGDVEVYHHEARARIPLVVGKARRIALTARVQGCAEDGICYPPHDQKVALELPAVAAAVQPASPASAAKAEEAAATLSSLNQELGLQEETLLPPEQAYQFSAEVADPTHLRLHWRIADGTYLYRDKTRVTLEKGEGVRLGPFELPRGERKHTLLPDGSEGEVEVFHGDVELLVPLQRTHPGATGVVLVARYQGCAEQGVCYPPQTRRVQLQLPPVEPAAPGKPAAGVTAAAPKATKAASGDEKAVPEAAEYDRLSSILLGGNLWLVIAAFYVAGLGLAFTPCVFPMIPILSGIIAGHGRHITPAKGFVLSLVYVLAMALTYTVAGVLAGLFGENLQAMFQNPWVLSIFAAIFVLLALSMFGFFELQLPSRLQSRLSEISNRQQGGHLAGVAIMGLLSALIVGPCLAPPLAAALIVIGHTGDAALGGTALFFLALGMGTPLIAIGTSAGKLLPRAGSWMDAVKAVFGVIMLAVAIYLLERIVPPAVALLLWGTLLIVSAVYMGALRQLPVEASGWARLWKGLGVVLLIYGGLMLVGAAANSKDTLQPLRGLGFGAGAGAAASTKPVFRPIKSIADLQRQLAAAKRAGRPVMLDFYADWCTYCVKFDKYVFSDPKVAALLHRFVLLRADVTANDATDKALMAHIGIPAPPAIILWGSDGVERRHYRILGYMGADDFIKHVRRAIGS